MALEIQADPIRIDSGKAAMEGMLWLPDGYTGMVVFTSGSNRVKPPHDYIANMLRNARLGTLWLDLQSRPDGESLEQVDIDLYVDRLNQACDWLQQHNATRDLPVGLFGAGRAAAAALQLAAMRGRSISALVLRGGRLDLAAHGTLGKISTPTLLIVGGLDDSVIATNRAAYAALRCKKRLEVIPGATHSFDEPGSLEVVARLARGWFLQHTDRGYG